LEVRRTVIVGTGTDLSAARFAAKEAGMKAIGTGWKRGVHRRDFEVINLPSVRPTLRFHGVAAKFAEDLGVISIALSLTHTAAQAVAIVVLEAELRPSGSYSG
jgi:holo-[acyl-carrier protein] synthase